MENLVTEINFKLTKKENLKSKKNQFFKVGCILVTITRPNLIKTIFIQISLKKRPKEMQARWIELFFFWWDLNKNGFDETRTGNGDQNTSNFEKNWIFRW